MERNSIGQVVIKESGSLLLSIPCITSTISVNTYNRFLLDEREFTELTPTIDKDALINRLESELLIANTTITQNQINALGGCNVGITNEQVVKAGINKQKITFDTVSGGVYYNSIQSNGLPVYSLAEQAAILYEDATSERFYTLKATIKYRYRYIGLNEVTKTTTQIAMEFLKDNSNGVNQKLNTIGSIVDRTDNITGTYSPGDVTGLYTINLLSTDNPIGGITDKIFIQARSTIQDFELVIYPGSTFTIIPE